MHGVVDRSDGLHAWGDGMAGTRADPHKNLLDGFSLQPLLSVRFAEMRAQVFPHQKLWLRIAFATKKEESQLVDVWLSRLTFRRGLLSRVSDVVLYQRVN